MKPVDVNSSTYIDFNKENNNKDSQFKNGDYIEILKYKGIFPEGYVPNLSDEVFQKVKSLKIKKV